MKDKSDPSGLYGNHRAGVWNEAQRKEATQINNALKYWQDLACANRKVAEDAQTQRDKAREDALEAAAKVCEQQEAADHCAAAIRALKK